MMLGCRSLSWLRIPVLQSAGLTAVTGPQLEAVLLSRGSGEASACGDLSSVSFKVYSGHFIFVLCVP